MGARTRCGSLLASMLLMFSSGCSGGGGGGGSTVDITGSWLVYLNVTGEEIGPFSVFLNQTGNALDGVSITGTVNGNTFTATSLEFFGIGLQLNGTVNGTTAQGSLAIANTPITGTFRMDSFAPAGSLSVAGNVQGVPVSVTSNIAAGTREYDDVMKTNLSEIEVSFGDGAVYVELSFLPGGLGLGSHTAGTDITVTVDVADDMQSIQSDAVGGTVNVTRYDGTGFAASYTLTLAGGGTVTGSFDVTWDILAYEP